MYYVYILESEEDGRRYIGSTNNIDRRVAHHNAGYVRSTKSRIPFKLVYKEEFKSEVEARERERYLKTHKGYNELMKIFRSVV